MIQQAVKRDIGLDLVRAMAIVMVVIIHTASGAATAGVGSANWYGALSWAALARPAVPLFFMCSGALMLGRDIPLKRLYGHNMLRVIVAMLVWAFVYQLDGLTPGQLTPANLWYAVKSTLVLNHVFHFYYLHILILVYAFVPIVRVFIRGASRREVEYLLVIWLAVGILTPLLQSFWPFTLVSPMRQWYKMNMSYAAIGYGVLGWYLKQYGNTIAGKWYWLAFTGGLALTFGGTAILSLRAGWLVESFLEGMSPGPMLMAFGLFGLMANRESWPGWLEKAGGRLALSSFCIYLIHILVLVHAREMGLDPAASPSLVIIPLSVLAVMIPSYLCWEVLRHIPIVKTWLI